MIPQLTVYNTEIYERNPQRYIVFGVVFFIVVLMSLYVPFFGQHSSNTASWYDSNNYFGVILLFFLLGSYLFYTLSQRQKIDISIHEDTLQIDKKMYPRSSFAGFVLEMNTQTNLIKNIVIVFPDHKLIFTIHDGQEKIKPFIDKLSEHLDMLDEYQQSPLEKIVRALKL